MHHMQCLLNLSTLNARYPRRFQFNHRHANSMRFIYVRRSVWLFVFNKKVLLEDPFVNDAMELFPVLSHNSWKSLIIISNFYFFPSVFTSHEPRLLMNGERRGSTDLIKLYINTNKYWKPIFHYDKYLKFSFFGHLLDFKHRNRANSSQQVM